MSATSSSFNIDRLPLVQATERSWRQPSGEQAKFGDELRKSAEQLVASALLIPIFEEMASSPLRPEDGPFAENIVEKRFGPMLHQHLADRMMQSRSFGLVDAVVERMRPARSPGSANGTLEVKA